MKKEEKATSGSENKMTTDQQTDKLNDAEGMKGEMLCGILYVSSVDPTARLLVTLPMLRIEAREVVRWTFIEMVIPIVETIDFTFFKDPDELIFETEKVTYQG